MIEKKFADALEPLIDAIVDVEKKLESIQLTPGPAGKDGEHGKDGHDGERGADGKDVDPAIVADLLKSNTEFVGALKGDRGEAGQDGKSVDASEVAKALKGDDWFLEATRGEAGSAGVGIKSLVQDADDRLTIILDNDTEVHVELPKGDKGDCGRDGLGIEVKLWEPGVYRKDTFTMANLGQFFKAVRDTASEPGKSDDWVRVGSFGFAWKGVKKEGAEYQDGDLYIDGGSTFLFINGKGRIFAQRGAKGDQGLPGKDGVDAPRIIAGKFYENELSFVLSDGEVLSADIDGLKTLWHGEFQKSILEALDAQHAARMARGAPLTEFRGYWSQTTEYSVGDVVTHSNATWVCVKSPVIGRLDSDSWTKIASIGGGSVSSSSSSSHRAESLPGFLPDDTIRNETFPVKHNRINIFRGSWADLNTTGKPGLQFVDDTGNGLDFSNNLYWDVAGLTDYSAGTLGPWALSDARAGVSNIAGAISAYGPVTAEAIYDHNYRLEIDTTKSTKTTILYEAWYVTTAGDQIYLMCKMTAPTAPKKLYGVKFISASADVNWTATRD